MVLKLLQLVVKWRVRITCEFDRVALIKQVTIYFNLEDDLKSKSENEQSILDNYKSHDESDTTVFGTKAVMQKILVIKYLYLARVPVVTM